MDTDMAEKTQILDERTSSSTIPSNTSAKGSQDESPVGGMKDYLRIFTFSSPTDILFNVVGSICAIGAGAALPLMTLIFGGFVTKFTDFGSGRSSPAAFQKDVNSFTLWFVYLFIGKFILTYGSISLFTISALRITSTMRSQFIKATLRQEIGFFDNVGPGSIAVRTTTNANRVNSGIAEKLARLIQSLAMVIAALVVGLVQSWKLTLIVIAVVLPLFILLAVTMTIDANIEARILRVYSQASNLAEELLGSIKTIRAFGAAPNLLKKYDEWLVKASADGFKKSLNLAILYGGEFFFAYVPYALAFWQGARMYLSGDLDSVGTLVTVVFSVLMIAVAIAQIAPSITSFIQASSAASELFEALDRQPLLDSSDDSGEKPPSITGHIEIHNVSFSYPARPDIPVLKNVSFDIPANKVTALVGASGSGKSTIIALLERWYEPTSGFVSVDGHKIDQLNVKWLRSKMRLEPVLFNDTIFNNVIQGLTGSEHEFDTREEKWELVMEACKAANAAEFIDELGEGYETNVGEHAGLLSGGQKQRIAIARSIISNPRILLLDEATSALDAQSEGIVQNALDRVSKSRTTVVIAHKLATVMKADNIIVLGQGEIIEQGTHQELLRRDGAYAKLVNAQQLGGSTQRPRDEDQETDYENDSIEEIVGEPIGQKVTSVKSYKSSPESSMEFKPRNLVQSLAIFLSENSNLWPWYLATFVAALIGGGVYPAQAILLSRLITAFELPRNNLQAEVNLFALMFFILAIICFVAYAILGWATNVISQVLTRRYRFEMLESLLRQDISFFDKPENAAAALTSRLSTMPSGLQELVGMNLSLLLIVMVNLVSDAILALVYGWKLGLVVFFGALPLIFGSGYLRIRLEMKFDDENSAVFADSARFASEAVGAIRTVVSFTIENSVSAAYDARLQRILQNSLGNIMLKMFWYSLADSVEFLAMALGFWYGGKLLADGEYTTNQFFIIYIAIVFGGQAAGQFFAYSPNITKAHAGGNYILKLRYSQAQIANDPDAKKPDPDSGYRFNKVHFRYPMRNHVSVLRGLNLEITPGTSVAFVGGSGCGKSTTIGLLERYYDPTYGSVCFGSDALPDLQLSEYRSCLSLVSQEPTLYQGSIRENIAFGGVGPVSEEQVEQAAKDANIFDFVMSLPEGMGTDCGSRGTQLSGGQKQRIAIARALMRDPKVLLLDEATSALDTTSEKIVQESLRNASQGRTTISVAHRLSTIRHCDNIFVFENGRVAESGTHEQLLALNGRYQKMCEAQSLDRAE